MKIQEALKPTGKATYQGQTDVYVEIRFDNGANYLVWVNTEDNEIDGRVAGEEGGRVAYEMHFKDNWQPYHEVKEIRPEKAGEVWWHEGRDLKILIFSNAMLSLSAIDETGAICDIERIIHGYNGFTRVDPLIPLVEKESI